MKALTILFPLLFLAHFSFSQEPETDQVNKKAISSLGFIVGDWEGEGWMMGRDGQKHSFTQRETINFKLDSTVILVEGVGMANQKVYHNAMAIISHNKTDENFRFHSYLANGRSGEYKAELIDGKLYWYPADQMRYIIYLNENGQWYETGEMKRGEDWFQFFEMTLDRL